MFSFTYNNRSWLLFFLLSLVFLTLPDITFHQFFFDYSNISLFCISLLIITRLLFRQEDKSREIAFLQFLLIVYAAWIIFAAITHFSAMSKLEPLTFITVDRHTKTWGLWFLKRISFIYILYPVLFIAAIYLFRSNNNSHRLLFFLPVFSLPSLLVGVYQGLFNIQYLNDAYFAKIHRVSGLEIDANGFGISLFPLFALGVMGILLIRNLLIRSLFILLTALLLWCVFLSGSRTGFLGIVIFIITLPLILAWAYKKISGLKRSFLLSLSLLLIIMSGVAGSVLIQKNNPGSSILTKRFSLAIGEDIQETRVENILLHSHRPEMALQAYKLTKLSPLSGWGPGGFYRNLQNVRFRYGVTSPVIDNALNHYLQMSSELGILGVSFNVFLHLLPLFMVFSVRKNIGSIDDRIATGITITIIIIMLFLYVTGPHTLFFSILWIIVALQSFLVAAALKNGYLFTRLKLNFIYGFFICLTFLFITGTYYNAFGKEGYKNRTTANWWPHQYNKNCYQAEKWGKDKGIWCKKNASIEVLILKKELPPKVNLTLAVHHPDVQSKPVTVKYGGKSGAVNEVIFYDKSWQSVEIPVSADYLIESVLPNKKTRKYFVISLDVSRTWTPQEWGKSRDPRELGVAVLISDLSRQFGWKPVHY
jgi:O-antigen ligase